MTAAHSLPSDLTTDKRRQVGMNKQGKVYIDGKVYVCRGNNIVRIRYAHIGDVG
ncbi:hypothetical protein FDI11_gp08 [Mycobacterium phage Tiger]|uniref:Uncharacterized protein n=2 Tax=Benedictvirus TaxID=2946819 RepID=H9NCZ6_9CAUD|nr:hypothetical protein X823_gp07 [Mycobacterium phage Conspiracy]YP_008859109.1 hypothetical protein X816_gp07 [Mycobacterium phage Jovo]YP_009607727.1 hypothetical protein FDI11_gp08 [Mycobacterium phage Tiger]ATW60058.1 hypothetical protein SEA_PHLORENCE_84 [Mycobacterium phage Phlorence]ATW60479.1 hypothetical protein SEA_FORGETIT_87 [Mycobacterium phage ForGetIt]ATW61032.1 hypothetical protein SEA_ARAGOG_86 [Mycobacterium phage Aragog]ATW61273.1 hypothetical protein SEA_AGENTM_85 [Mycoba